MEEENIQDYEMPTTELDSKGNPILSPSSGADVITAVGSVSPDRFWMIFMIVLSVALGLTLFFGGSYMISEIKTKNEEIQSLKKELKDCPEETINRIKKELEGVKELKNMVLEDSHRIDSTIEKKSSRIDKLQQIDNALKK